MAKGSRPAIEIIGEEAHVLHATWSRSGRSLILTVARHENLNQNEQVVLGEHDVSELARFLVAGPDA
jgi:hypothetical protein